MPLPAVLLGVSFLLAACGTAPVNGEAPAMTASGRTTEPAPASTPPMAYASAAQGADYRVSPHDILDVTVWQVPELSRVAQVSATGTISLPLIGAVPAAGRTTGEIEAAVAARLGATYLQNPHVTVSVKEAAGRSVTVDGAVTRPGVFPLTGSISLLQAVAMAGGVNDVADPSLVTVTRMMDGQTATLRVDLAAIKAGQAPDPGMLAGDIVMVGESPVKTGLRDTARTLAPITAAAGVWRPW